jgi:hypothetical protein
MYKGAHEVSPGKQRMDALVEGLKINIRKMLSRKKTQLLTERLPFEAMALKGKCMTISR